MLLKNCYECGERIVWEVDEIKDSNYETDGRWYNGTCFKCGKWYYDFLKDNQLEVKRE